MSRSLSFLWVAGPFHSSAQSSRSPEMRGGALLSWVVGLQPLRLRYMHACVVGGGGGRRVSVRYKISVVGILLFLVKKEK